MTLQKQFEVRKGQQRDSCPKALPPAARVPPLFHGYCRDHQQHGYRHYGDLLEIPFRDCAETASFSALRMQAGMEPSPCCSR